MTVGPVLKHGKRAAKKRARVKRFYYIGSKRSRTLHLSRHITEGYRTLCGILIFLGWKWARSRSARRNAKRAALCRKCLKRAPPIIVARVRR
jgi:hypothetical protein